MSATHRPRVALVRLSSLGDVALAGAAVEALTSRATVAFATRAGFAPLYRDDPRLDSLIAVDPDDLRAASAAMEAFRPDVVVDLQGSLRSRQLTASLRVPSVRVRKASIRRRLALIGVTMRAGPHVYERYLEVLGGVLSGEVPAASPRLHVTPSAAERAAGALPSGKTTWIGLLPGAAWANKRWPLERWIALASALLTQEGVGAAVFVGPLEDDIHTAFADRFRGEDRVRVVRAGLDDLGGYLARVAVLVGGDSGPMHVAEAVGTPVVALFGPTSPSFGFAPFLPASRVVERRLMCRPCHVHGGNRCPLGHHRCMRDIAVSAITEEVRAVVAVSASGGDALSDQLRGRTIP